ncbi:MAG: Crp/Fnr family transcriptional regulator [Novosphingobium sp.]|uniref:Crp/Fnr family transcriptional regulator n=1 Tax=Novosphingobium sp. TaxID=1874826 RepID=UPI002734F94D|nr:Crp/Fnr family transcriptional regulator [Novosphingobium sp.]MDP3551868.1 Crp/Fnr family transcriptional regulator [Novosphingobium sp.]
MARDDELPARSDEDVRGHMIRNGGAPCLACPLEACPGLHQPQSELRGWIATFRLGEVRFARGEQVFAQGARLPHLFTVLSGVLMRTRLLEDGRRQIINFMFPGDFIGLQAALDEEMSHSVEALTSVTLCTFARGRFFELAAQQPQLSFDLTWLAAHEEAALEEHIVSLGQRNARERMVALAVFLVQRGMDTGLAPNGLLPLTVTQGQIADMLGLSLVHTNRSLQALRRLGLVDWTLSAIRIPDMDEARRFARLDAPSPSPRPYI